MARLQVTKVFVSGQNLTSQLGPAGNSNKYLGISFRIASFLQTDKRLGKILREIRE